MRSDSSSWFNTFAKLGLRQKRKRRTSSPTRYHRRLRLESLESRNLLSITVNTLIDENDGISIGGISLRDAVAHAATLAGTDTIDFDPSLIAGTIELSHGEIVIDSDVVIDGLAQTIDAGGASRIFNISGATASISGLALTGGNATSFGGAILNNGNLALSLMGVFGNHAASGGGVYSGSGLLYIEDSTFSENSATGSGGAVFTDSNLIDALVIDGCVFFGNQAHSCGALRVDGNDEDVGTATILNSTFSGNIAVGGAAGAICTGSEAPLLTIVNCTIAQNQAQWSGGGIHKHHASNITLHNTIVAENVSLNTTNENIYGSMNATSSYNLIGFGGTGGMSDGDANHNIVLESGETAGLGELGNHGGPTLTHALLHDSPAIDAGSDARAVYPDGEPFVFDQRYEARNVDTVPIGPSGGTVDIGAYEYEFSGLVAPQEVNARAIGPTSIEVTWQASTHATSYEVYRRQPDTEQFFTLIASDITTTTYTDSTATTQTLYQYSVRAVSANGVSAFSQIEEATADRADLTAYRPQSLQDPANPVDEPIYDRETEGGFPGGFPKTPVREQYEDSSTLGPGIRANWDWDNGGFDRPDVFESGYEIEMENDLIEVKVERLQGQGDFVLTIGSKLGLYYTHDKETPVPMNGLTSEPLPFVNDTITVFVEYRSSTHGTDTVNLVDPATSVVVDSLRFHSFRSMVVVFGGRTQNPRDTDGNGSINDVVAGQNEEGIFDVAQRLYDAGWDVMAFDSTDVNIDNVVSVAEAEIKNAYDRRFVSPLEDGTGVAILGYSWGGGVTHDLVERLYEDSYFPTFAVYLDAVVHPFVTTNAPQDDWPNETFYLLNIWQPNQFFEYGGGPISNPGDMSPFSELEEIDVVNHWGLPLDHYLIDDDLQVKLQILTRIDELILR